MAALSPTPSVPSSHKNWAGMGSPGSSRRLNLTGTLGATGAAGTAAGAGAKRSGLDFERVIKLFLNKHTADLYDRQAAILQRVAVKSSNGFFIKDLPQVNTLLQLATEKMEAAPDMFVPPILHMITLCGKPFQRSHANEEFRSVENVCSLMQTVGEAVQSKVPQIRLTAVQTLQRFANGTPGEGPRSADDARPSSRTYNQDVLSKSGALDYSVEALRGEILAMFSHDKDGDGKMEAEEFHSFRVATDGDAGNDDQQYDPERAALEESGKVRAVPYFLGSLVELIWQLSSFPSNALQLVQLGAPQLLMQLLGAIPNFRERVVFLSIEILWNMLHESERHVEQGEVSTTLAQLCDKHRGHNAAHLLGTAGSVWTLCSMFERLLINGFKHSDKELRNELVVVATYIARHAPNRALFVSSGFLTLLLEYSTAAEMTLPVDANARNFATSDAVDLELKTLLWSLIGTLCEATPAAVEAVGNSMFMHTLLLYIDPATVHHPYLLIWAPAQRRSLQLLALSLLNQLAPGMASQFQAYSGLQVTLDHIRAHSANLSVPQRARRASPGPAIDEDDVFGADETGDQGELGDIEVVDEDENDIDRQYAAMRLLESVVPQADFRDILGKDGAVEDLLQMLDHVPSSAHSSTTAHAALAAATGGGAGTMAGSMTAGGSGSDSMAVTTANATPSDINSGMLVEAIVGMLASLCSGHVANQKALRRAGGIDALLSWLRYEPQDSVDKPMVLVAVVAAVWEAIVGNRKSENKFITADGVDALLDLLEMAPRIMHNQILGCLADLLRNKLSHSYFSAWRSDRTGNSAAHVLLDMWRAEETRLGITHDTDGASLSNLDRPLEGTGKPKTPGSPAGAGAGAGAAAPGSTDSPRSGPDAFDRLRRALKASKLWSQVEQHDPEADLIAAVHAKDLRYKVFAVFNAVDKETVLSAEDVPHEHQIAGHVACNVYELAEGQAWGDVKSKLHESKINMIHADALQVEQELDAAYGLAQSIKFEQHQLLASQDDADAAKETRFLDMMRTLKESDEQAALLAAMKNPRVIAHNRTKHQKTVRTMTASELQEASTETA